MWNSADLGNCLLQSATSGGLPLAQIGGTAVGTYGLPDMKLLADMLIVMPTCGVLVKSGSNFTGATTLNYKNVTNKPVLVKPAGDVRSINIYRNDVELTG